METLARRCLLRDVMVIGALALGSGPAVSWAQESAPSEPSRDAEAPAPSSPPAVAPPSHGYPTGYGSPPPDNAGPYAYPPRYGFPVVWRDPKERDDGDKDDADDLPPGPGMRDAGVALTVMGAAAAIVGVVLVATVNPPGHWRSYEGLGIAMGITGGVTAATGIPLWVAGASRYDAKQYEAAREANEQKKKKRSRPKESWPDSGMRPGPGMRNAGAGLAVGGGAVGAISAVFFLTSGNTSELNVAGGVFAGVAGAMVLTGIPLWAVGAARYEQKPASQGIAGVSLSIGAKSAAVQGRF